jgi:hypothetical protein
VLGGASRSVGAQRRSRVSACAALRECVPPARSWPGWSRPSFARVRGGPGRPLVSSALVTSGVSDSRGLPRAARRPHGVQRGHDAAAEHRAWGSRALMIHQIAIEAWPKREVHQARQPGARIGMLMRRQRQHSGVPAASQPMLTRRCAPAPTTRRC